MDMNINAALIRTERLKRAWSQEHLAHVSRLGLRTVQRIERGGNASLESVKALAAVLELPVQAVLIEEVGVETPLQSGILPTPSPFSLFKPWRAFVAGSVATLVTMGSLVSMQSALAEQVALDFAVTLNGEQLSKSRMSSEDGSEAVVEISNLLKVSLTPFIRDDGLVLIKASIYLFQEGEFDLVASPTILAKDAQPGKIIIGSADMKLEFDVTPTID